MSSARRRGFPWWLFMGAFAACAAPASEPSIPVPTPDVRELPPGKRPEPFAPFTTDRTLLRERVAEALDRHERDRWERFVDAIDRGELSEHAQLSQEKIETHRYKTEWIFQHGDELFEHDFAEGEGFGPGRLRIHLGPGGGPDALSCAECHHRGGFDGSGELSQNAFFDGDGKDPSTAFERNAPHLLGLGPVQRLAEEMTADLQHARDLAVMNAKQYREPQTAALHAKGIHFGEIVARPDGSLDTTKVAGVDADLVVKPFGWKGSTPGIPAFVVDGFQRHHGVQLAGKEARGAGPEWDRDGDGMPAEISPGMVTTVATYLALLEVPVMIPPEDPTLLERHGRGAAIFASAGCVSCHVPSLPLVDPKLSIATTVVDVVRDGEAPRPRFDVSGIGTPVFLFSDLKRHDMGPKLAEARDTAQGIPRAQFLTRSLWGVADTAPYLHDGRATTLDEAILLHGGDAQRARDAFAALPASSRADVRIFLLSLTRYPRITLP